MTVVIGGTGIQISTNDPAFDELLRTQYAGFIGPDTDESIRMTVNSCLPDETDADADIRVYQEGDCWLIERGDFQATYDPALRAAVVARTAGRYGLDSAIRIIHSLIVAEHRGFLLHASSVIRKGRAFLFAGPSGAGKTTISRLAEAEDHLLTDEISYVRCCSGVWTAFGTPFAGELARPGENRAAGVEALYLLRHAAENRLEPLKPAAAAHAILRNVLFFADEPRLTRQIFDTVCKFVESVRVFDLGFLPDSRVWSLIQ